MAKDTPNVAEILKQGKAIEDAVRRGWRDAVVLHKKLGQPMVVWKDGEVVWVSPEELDPDLESTPT
jgi:hypothetical protein